MNHRCFINNLQKHIFVFIMTKHIHLVNPSIDNMMVSCDIYSWSCWHKITPLAMSFWNYNVKSGDLTAGVWVYEEVNRVIPFEYEVFSRDRVVTVYLKE
jgi:hypothetical protein